MYSVHRLVAISFIPNPLNLPQVNHKDEDRLNNRLDNLEWCTAKYNLDYGTRNIKCTNFNKKNFSKRVYQYSKNKVLVKKWDSLSEAEKEGCFNHSGVSDCCLGKRKHYKNYIWSYELLKEAN